MVKTINLYGIRLTPNLSWGLNWYPKR